MGSHMSVKNFLGLPRPAEVTRAYGLRYQWLQTNEVLRSPSKSSLPKVRHSRSPSRSLDCRRRHPWPVVWKCQWFWNQRIAEVLRETWSVAANYRCTNPINSFRWCLQWTLITFPSFHRYYRLLCEAYFTSLPSAVYVWHWFGFNVWSNYEDELRGLRCPSSDKIWRAKRNLIQKYSLHQTQRGDSSKCLAPSSSKWCRVNRQEATVSTHIGSFRICQICVLTGAMLRIWRTQLSGRSCSDQRDPNEGIKFVQ